MRRKIRVKRYIRSDGRPVRGHTRHIATRRKLIIIEESPLFDTQFKWLNDPKQIARVNEELARPVESEIHEAMQEKEAFEGIGKGAACCS